jgi:Protein of unknown function (DUF3800)
MTVPAKPLTAYGDDSGKRQSEYLFVGGWLGEAGPLAMLQEEWLSRIRAHGLVEFKRSKYNEKRLGAEFLHQLIGLIHRYTLHGYAYGIQLDDYQKVQEEYALDLYHLVPYSICARTCIGLVRQWWLQTEIRHDHIGYIFDKGSEGAGELIELLKIDASAEARTVVSSLSTDDSEQIAALQASDFLAWEIRNQYLKDPEGNDLDAAVTDTLKHLMAGRIDDEGLPMRNSASTTKRTFASFARKRRFHYAKTFHRTFGKVRNRSG